MDKRGQTGGLIGTIIFGVAGVVITTIIAFIIISTLIDSDVLGTTTNTVTNETDAFFNSSGYTLAGESSNGDPRGYAITEAYNITNVSNPILIGSGNYTVDTSTGVVTNATTLTFPDVNISYTYTTDSGEGIEASRMSANVTEGVGNISAKIPTVLLVSAIVLVLSIIAVLIEVYRRIKLSGSSPL